MHLDYRTHDPVGEEICEIALTENGPQTRHWLPRAQAKRLKRDDDLPAPKTDAPVNLH